MSAPEGRTVAAFPRFAPSAGLRYDVDRERGETRTARTGSCGSSSVARADPGPAACRSGLHFLLRLPGGLWPAGRFSLAIGSTAVLKNGGQPCPPPPPPASFTTPPPTPRHPPGKRSPSSATGTTATRRPST